MTAVAVLAAVLTGVAVLTWPSGRPGSRRARQPVAECPATVAEASAALGLVAAALRGGTGSIEALEAVAAVDTGAAGRELAVVAVAQRWGESPEQAWARVGPGWSGAAVAWHAAHEAGAAPAGLLAAAASRMRQSEARRLEAALHRSGVLLVLPLGLCFLPGFLGTTILPVVVCLLRGLAP